MGDDVDRCANVYTAHVDRSELHGSYRLLIRMPGFGGNSGPCKDGWQGRVSLRPTHRRWIQRHTLPRSYLLNHNVLERSYTFGNDGMGL